jgi:hypothetical protein
MARIYRGAYWSCLLLIAVVAITVCVSSVFAFELATTLETRPSKGAGTTFSENLRQNLHSPQVVEEPSEFWAVLGYRLKVTDSLLVLFTALLFAATCLLWKATKGLVIGADKTSKRQLRAYVFLNGTRYTSHVDIPSGTIFWRIRVAWKNGGVTPTRLLHLNINSQLRHTPLPDDFDFPEASGHAVPMLLGPNASATGMPVDVRGADLIDVTNGLKFFYIWGSARYHDVFEGTAEHVTKFCVHVDTVTGDPKLPYDAATNIVEIGLPYYFQNNCMDEGCP